ncbi:unnamed protein product [Schistosoma rodhaini]|nr:unnamed protein product [Schistosoma rodhaini]
MKLAFVTGSNKGIGYSIVEKLAEFYGASGEWDIYLTARNVELGQEAVKKLSNKGLDVKFHQLDITDQNSRKAFLTFVERNYPNGINIAVNNAGIAYKANSAAPFGEQARVTVNTNFTSTIDFMEEFIPLLAKHARFAEDGTYSEKGWPSNAYGVSKIGLTKASFIFGEMLKDDPREIVINSCCPGYCDTDMTSHKGTKTADEGADTPFYLATLPVGSKEPINQFVYERRVIKWSK